MKHLLLKSTSLLLCIVALSADDIGVLLEDYEKASELSLKTKNESAGHLVVYTRDQLERMQAHSLKDLLKSLRFYGYAQSRMGLPDMMNRDPIAYYSKTVRVYLDEHELLNPIAGSGFIHFGDIELDFVDHVEIYEGFPSFDFGVEPALLVIHLYSKTPEHDSGGKVVFNYGNNQSNKQSLHYAQQYDEFSFFSYISRDEKNEDAVHHENKNIDNEGKTERFLLSLSTQHHKLQLHGVQVDKNMFLGSLIGAVPESTRMENRFFEASLTSGYLDDTLQVNLSFLHTVSDFFAAYDEPASILNSDPQSAALMPLIPIDLIDQTIREKSMTVGLKKKWPMQKHTLSLGAQFRHKHFDTTDVTFHSPLNIEFPPLTQAYYTENVYSLFLQDLYEINEKQVLSASVMLQHYDRRGDVEDQNTAQIRLGYIYSDRAWVSKTFLSQQQFASEPYMTVSAHYGNAALKAESYNMLTQEISYEKDASHTTLLLAYGKKNRAPFLEAQTFQMHNADEDIKAYAASLEWRYDFRDNDILQLQAFLSNNQTLGREGDDRRVYGGMARLLNSIDSFDVFNELTYREGYFDHDAGIDYSAGVIYHVSKDFSLNVKGENIFNNAVEWEYANRIDYNTMKATDTITKPTIEQKFWIGMEYLF